MTRENRPDYTKYSLIRNKLFVIQQISRLNLLSPAHFMNYNYVGIELLKVAAFLFAARYITAGLRFSGMDTYYAFSTAYASVGSGLTIGAGISAGAGIAALYVAAKKQSVEKINNKETRE